MLGPERRVEQITGYSSRQTQGLRDNVRGGRLVLIVDNIPFRGDFAGALVAAAVFDALVAFLTGALVALVAAALATV